MSGHRAVRCGVFHATATDDFEDGFRTFGAHGFRLFGGFLKHRGIGVLITDHNVRETLDIIDRAYILHDGTVLMEGAPEDSP